MTTSQEYPLAGIGECPVTLRRRARALFRGTFGDSSNFMTPELIEYRIVGQYAVELSRGSGIWNNALYGVTVLELDGSRTSLGACFDTPEDMLGYVAQLNE